MIVIARRRRRSGWLSVACSSPFRSPLPIHNRAASATVLLPLSGVCSPRHPQPPANSAGPVLLAGFTEGLVMGMPEVGEREAKADRERREAHGRPAVRGTHDDERNVIVSTISARRHENRPYWPVSVRHIHSWQSPSEVKAGAPLAAAKTVSPGEHAALLFRRCGSSARPRGVVRAPP